MTIKRHNPGPVLCRAVEHGGLVYVAGTTADNKSASCKEQTEEVLKKIDAALAAAGSDKSKLLWAQVWLTDIREKEQMDAAWKAWVLPDEQAGARLRRGAARHAGHAGGDHGDGREVDARRRDWCSVTGSA